MPPAPRRVRASLLPAVPLLFLASLCGAETRTMIGPFGKPVAVSEGRMLESADVYGTGTEFTNVSAAFHVRQAGSGGPFPTFDVDTLYKG
jgi:hypothetical protein